jgi:hypothetical protein
MPGYIATLTSSVRGDLELRRAPSRMAAFQAARALLVEAEAREAQRKWMHNEIISIRVQADPDRP